MNDQLGKSVPQGSSHLIEDIHICGTCKLQFHDIEKFILHKRQCALGVALHQPLAAAPSQQLLPQPPPPDDQITPTTVAHIPTDGGFTDHPTTELPSAGQPSEGTVLLEATDSATQVVVESLATGNPVSLQSALLASQGSVSLINQSGGQHTQVPMVTHQVVNAPPVGANEQILSQSTIGQGTVEVTAHNLQEYTNSQSLMKVLQGGSTAAVATLPVQSPSKGIKKVMNTVKKFQCEHAGCEFSTAYQKDLGRHMRIHTGERPFECPICKKTFNRGDKLNIHLRGHSGKKPYACPHCNYASTDSSSLKKHIRVHTDERPFKCQICQYASRNSSQLIVHLRTHTGDAPFQCQLCSAKFKINSDLKRHMRLHTGEKPFKCEYCNYCCAIKGNLKNHYRINHSTEHVMRCGQCEFETSSQRAFREHFKQHESAARPFMCPTCQYTCASRTTLKVHQRIHSDERPYKCTYCTYCSRQSGNIRTHMRRKHPERLRGGTVRRLMKKEDPEGQALVGSEEKGTDARKGKGVGDRIRPVCKKPFTCTTCDAAFVREDSLRSHMRQHRDVDRDMALKVESTALAVLQLSNPVTMDLKKEAVNRDVQVQPEHHPASSFSQSHEQVIKTGPTILQNQPASQSTAAPVIAASPVATMTTSSTRTVTTAHPSHSHILDQAASNRLAFVQNNQNKAIEDNFQNAAISLNRAEAAARRPQESWSLQEKVLKQPVTTTGHKFVYQMAQSPNVVQSIQNVNRVRVAPRPVQQQQQQQQKAQIQQQQQQLVPQTQTVTVSAETPITTQHIVQQQHTASDQQHQVQHVTLEMPMALSDSVPTMAGHQQVLDASTVAAIQSQLSHIHPPGTPISIQIVQTENTGSVTVVPQKIQFVLPTSTVPLSTTGGNVQLATTAGFPQPVILQVPPGTENLVDTSSSVQLPLVAVQTMQQHGTVQPQLLQPVQQQQQIQLQSVQQQHLLQQQQQTLLQQQLQQQQLLQKHAVCVVTTAGEQVMTATSGVDVHNQPVTTVVPTTVDMSQFAVQTVEQLKPEPSGVKLVNQQVVRVAPACVTTIDMAQFQGQTTGDGETMKATK